MDRIELTDEVVSRIVKQVFVPGTTLHKIRKSDRSTHQVTAHLAFPPNTIGFRKAPKTVTIVASGPDTVQIVYGGWLDAPIKIS